MCYCSNRQCEGDGGTDEEETKWQVTSVTVSIKPWKEVFFALCVDGIIRKHHACCFYACSSLIWSFCYLSLLFFWVEKICNSFMYQCVVERTGAIFLWCKRLKIEGKNYISLLRNLNSNVKSKHQLCKVKFDFISTNRRLNAHEVSKHFDVNSWWWSKDRRNMNGERNRKSDILTQKCYSIFDNFIFICSKIKSILWWSKF